MSDYTVDTNYDAWRVINEIDSYPISILPNKPPIEGLLYLVKNNEEARKIVPWLFYQSPFCNDPSFECVIRKSTLDDLARFLQPGGSPYSFSTAATVQ